MFSYKGYTLVFANSGKFAALLDMEGRVCHRWEYQEGLTYAVLLPNGNLLGRTPLPPDFEPTRGLGGSGGSIVELDWDGVKVWEHRDPFMHHDYERSLTGSTYYLLWEEMPADCRRVCAAVTGRLKTQCSCLATLYVRSAMDGETANEWRVWENLSIESQVICPLEGRREWTHANSIHVTKSGDFLLSFRSTSSVRAGVAGDR